MVNFLDQERASLGSKSSAGSREGAAFGGRFLPQGEEAAREVVPGRPWHVQGLRLSGPHHEAPRARDFRGRELLDPLHRMLKGLI